MVQTFSPNTNNTEDSSNGGFEETDEEEQHGAKGAGNGGDGARAEGGGGGTGSPEEDWSDSESLESGDESEEETEDDVEEEHLAEDEEERSPETTARPSGVSSRPSSSLSQQEQSQGQKQAPPAPETEVAVTEPQGSSISATTTTAAKQPVGVLKAGKGGGPLSNLKPVQSSSASGGKKTSFVGIAGDADGDGGGESSVSPLSPVKVGFVDSARQETDGKEDAGSAENRTLNKASTLPAMPRVSLLASGNKPKGGRKSVQFQVVDGARCYFFCLSSFCHFRCRTLMLRSCFSFDEVTFKASKRVLHVVVCRQVR